MGTKLLAGLLHRVGSFDPKGYLESFQDRLVLQKTVSILQDGFGVDLGYNFNWYLRGPYSPGLAKDGYDIAQDYDEYRPVRLKAKELEEQFRRFVDFIEPHRGDEEWLEIAASILYLYRRGVQHSDILQRVAAKRRSWTEQTVEDVWSDLARCQLVDSAKPQGTPAAPT